MTRAKVMAAGVLLALVLAFGFGLYAGVSRTAAYAQSFTIVASQPKDLDMSQFWKVWSVLQGNFVQTHASGTIPTDEEKLYGAIEGLTASYGDPYTVFLPPVDAQAFNEDISGTFSGVGMELGTKDKQLTVVAPLRGSPAEKAGIRSGDVVLAIDGVPSGDLAVDQAVKKIRGPKGTTVKLTLGRAGTEKPLEISIVRDTILVPIINNYKRPDGTYIIELYSFSETSTGLFRKALREYFDSGATKLILDLRGNPGGYLEAAVDMASFFLPVGETVVSEDYAGKQGNVAHRSYGYNVFANKKLSMVVLVDQGSASASEILAGALQQHNIAKLIGTRTFGKGSVQQLVELGGGAELKVTVAKWLTPNGSSISDGGLTPDIKAERSAEDRAAGKDPQTDAAVAWLATQ